jgi:hypothetical protein
MIKLALRAIPVRFVVAMANANSENNPRDFLAVLAVWLLLAGTLIFLAWPNISVPGLYYDEAQCAGMAKDFLTGHPHRHMPGTRFLSIGVHRFPMFAQIYIGAVKSWLLLPSFVVFGASLPVLRLTALCLGLGSLLLFMLWTWRWLGKDTALVAGALLALDPTFFFISVLDWGLVLPSFLCRFACFYFVLRWWQIRNEPRTREHKDSVRKSLFHAFFAGLFAGLGFFNKIDIAVPLAGVLLALLCCNARHLGVNLTLRRSAIFAKPLALASLGFLLTAGPMLTHIPTILNTLSPSVRPEGAPSELTEKFNTMLAMYDGSYFYRLMNIGGLFLKMYQTRAPIFAPLGIALILAAAYLVFRPGFRGSSGDPAAFLLLATLFITIGIFLLPGAVRIHHMVLVYPFPHLVVALAITRLWRRRRREEPGSPGQNVISPSSVLVAALFVLLLACQLLALHRTQQLIRQTGGRGWWSDALSAFARQVNGRSDLTIVSLDWGLNEQLAFLTDGPALVEPFWEKNALAPPSINCIYLVHPPDYALFALGVEFLEWSRRAGPSVVEVQPWYDHQNHVAFYSLRLRGR